MLESEKIDRSSIDSLLKLGKPALVVRMINLFLEAAPHRREVIRTTLANGDAKGVERGVHALKSSAGQLGGAALRYACQAAEDAAEVNAPNLKELVQIVESELDYFIDWITDFKKTLPDT